MNLYDRVISLTLVSKHSELIVVQEETADRDFERKLNQAKAAGKKRFKAYTGRGANRKERWVNVSDYEYKSQWKRGAPIPQYIEGKTRIDYNGTHDVITIPFTYNGYKPNISVSLTMIPSGFSFNIHVEVNNANILQHVNIQDFVAMSVRLGYTSGGTTLSYVTQPFTGPILASYVASPAPDNKIVFDGVAIGYTGVDIMRMRPYTVKFAGTPMTIGQVFTSIATQLAVPYDTSMCDESIMNAQMNFAKETVHADNAYSIINWMMSVFSAFAQGHTGADGKTYDADDALSVTHGVKVFVRFQNDKLYLISTNKTPEPMKIKQCPAITHIKSCSFSGPVLTLQAPYDPRLQPGDIFYMSPVYYNGGKELLNQLGPDIFNPSQGVFRIIKMDVAFATMGEQNDMSITAISAYYWIDDVDYTKDLISEVQVKVDDAKKEADKAESMTMQEEVITVGTIEPIEPEYVPPKDFWSSGWDPRNITYSSCSLASEQFRDCATFQMLAKAAWGDQLFYVDNQHMSQKYERYARKGVPVWYFYPLIQYTTYKVLKDKNPHNQQLEDMQHFIDINAPDAVWPEWEIYIPNMGGDINNFKKLLGDKQAADLIRYYGVYRHSIGDWEGMFMMQDLYNYLLYGSQ